MAGRDTAICRTTQRLLGGVVLVLGSSLSAAPAHARPRVVVLEFVGYGAVPARTTIAEGLAASHDVFGQPHWNYVADRLGAAPEANKTAVSRIAPELGAQAVITGEISARGGKKGVITLTVRDGKTGNVIDTVRFGTDETGIRSAERGTAVAAVRATIARGQTGQPTLPPAPLPQFPGYDTPATLGTGASGGTGATTDADLQTSASVASAAPVSAPPPLLQVALALNLVKRSLSFDAPQVSNFTSSPVAGFRLEVEGYPMRDSSDWTRDLGGALVYGQVLFMSSHDEVTDSDHSTSLREYALDLRYRHAVDRWGFVLKGIVGYGRMSFHIDWGDDTALVPDSALSFVRLGIDGAIRLTAPARLTGSLAFLPVFGSGDLHANGFGFGLVVGADWLFMEERLAVGARLRYTRFSLSGAATGNPGSDDAHAVDQYLMFGPEASYRF